MIVRTDVKAILRGMSKSQRFYELSTRLSIIGNILACELLQSRVLAVLVWFFYMFQTRLDFRPTDTVASTSNAANT